jgi:hypothetical protein
VTDLKAPIVALQFGDGPNDGRGRGEAFGMYDNGVWENVLNIEFTPNHGPRNPDGIKAIEGHALWLRDRKVDAVIWTLWMGAAPWMQRLKTMVPNLKIIALTDHPLNVDILVTEPGRSGAYVNSIEHADAVMVLTPREASFYGGIHPNVHYVGLPFPHGGYEYLRMVRTDPLPKKDVVIGLSVGGPEWCAWDRNILTTMYAFRHVARAAEARGVKVRGVWLSVTLKPGNATRKMMEATPDTVIQQRSDMQTYLKTLQSCDFVISNIVRDTPGRLVGEAAFFGVPCVGSHSLSLQSELFPTLSHDPFDIVSTVEKSLSLIHDGVPPSLIENAQRGLAEYGFPRSREKFRDVLGSVGLGAQWKSAEK